MPRGAILEGVGLGEALNFDSVEKAAQLRQQNEQLKFQYKKQEQKEREQKQKQAESGSKYFNTYINNKLKLTGSIVDPITNENINKISAQAAEMYKDGASTAEVIMATTPLIDEAVGYDLNAKKYANDKKLLLTQFAPEKVKGYNPEKLSEEMDNVIIEEGIRNFDPNKIGYYAEKAFDRKGLELTNDEGLNDYVKTMPFEEWKDKNVTVNWAGQKMPTDPAGNKINYTYNGKLGRDYEVEVDANGKEIAVPKYEHVKDGDNVITHSFDDGKGGKIDAPVRVVTDEVYKNAMSKEGVQERIIAKANDVLRKGEYKDKEGNPITADSPQAEFVKKAILYDELKRLGTINKIERSTNTNKFDKYNFADYQHQKRMEEIAYKAKFGTPNPNTPQATLFGMYSDPVSPYYAVEKINVPGVGEMTVVNTKKISAGDLGIIKKSGLEPINDKGNEYYIVKNTDNWVGEGGQNMFGRDIKYKTDKAEGNSWKKTPIVPKSIPNNKTSPNTKKIKGTNTSLFGGN